MAFALGGEPISMINSTPNELRPIVIIGAGPTGTALTIDLALRNTPSILVERYVNP